MKRAIIMVIDSMGIGATELLKKPNRKVFFVVFDPSETRVVGDYKKIKYEGGKPQIDTDTHVYATDDVHIDTTQLNVLTHFCQMFANPDNKEIMKNVEAIYFIATKCDTLAEDREERKQKVKNIFINEYYHAIKDTLKQLYQDYNINAVCDKKTKVFAFSLGDFYAGNMFEYDDTDSLNLIRAIQNSTRATRDKTIWEKIKDFLNG